MAFGGTETDWDEGDCRELGGDGDSLATTHWELERIGWDSELEGLQWDIRRA